jgi:hypothetical protein
MSKQTENPVKKPRKRGESSPPVAANQDKAAINAGLKTIEWLFREQLRVDAKWSVKSSNGFTWWADRHAQTVEVVGSETDESGSKGSTFRLFRRTPVRPSMRNTSTMN